MGLMIPRKDSGVTTGYIFFLIFFPRPKLNFPSVGFAWTHWGGVVGTKELQAFVGSECHDNVNNS